jgi:iron complex outermembrane recepter protein
MKNHTKLKRLRQLHTTLLVSCLGAVATARAEPTLPRVEITGSSIRRIDGESALPVQTIKRDAIERSGYTSTIDLLKNLPAVMGSSGESGTVGLETYGFAGVSIHNIGEDRTLVLLNGRRMARFGGQFLTGDNNAIDLNSIPISAIERIEILTDGASALYGSDAIAGVVNFITKRGGTDGVATAGVSLPRGGARESHISLSKGFGDGEAGDYSVRLSASADKRTSLAATERKFAKSGQIFFSEGGERYRFLAASGRSIPANVYDQDFNALNPYLAANGKCPARHIESGAACRYDFTGDLEIYPERDRQNLVVSFERRFDGGIKWFGDVLYARSRSRGTVSYNGTEVVIAPDSPYFAQAVAAGGYNNTDPLQGGLGVLASYRFADLGRRVTDDRSEAVHAVMGIEGTLRGWDYNLALTHSQNTVKKRLPSGYAYNSRALNALNTVVNPFALPGQQSAEARQAIADARYTGYSNGGKSTLDGVELRSNTELAALPALPGGLMQLGVGVSGFRETYDARPSKLTQGLGDVVFGDSGTQPPSSGGRNLFGAFAELLAPVGKTVELTAAVRHDHYSDFGDTTNGKLSGRWQPTPTLLIRGSVGTGYRAPSVLQVKAARQPYGSSGGNFDCAKPDRNGVTLNTPERSDQASVGFRVEPVPALSIGADLWTIALRHEITQLSEATILSDYNLYRSSFTSAVSAGSGRRQLALFLPNVNQGKSFNTGIDFDVAGRAQPWRGIGINSQLTATYLLRDQYQSTRGGAYGSSLGRFGEDGRVAFRWQARWVNAFSVGATSHTLALNYKSGYRDQDVAASGQVEVNRVNADGSIGAAVQSLKRNVSDHLTADWQSQWRFHPQCDVTVGVLNLFDTDPPRSLAVGGLGKGFQTGYDDRYYDPRGRTFYLNLTYRF